MGNLALEDYMLQNVSNSTKMVHFTGKKPMTETTNYDIFNIILLLLIVIILKLKF